MAGTDELPVEMAAEPGAEAEHTGLGPSPEVEDSLPVTVDDEALVMESAAAAEGSWPPVRGEVEPEPEGGEDRTEFYLLAVMLEVAQSTEAAAAAAAVEPEEE